MTTNQMNTEIANPPLTTEPDVRMLEERYKDAQIGQLITYEELEELLQIERHSNRWIAITSRWRRILLNRSITLSTIRGHGYQVSSNQQKLDISTGSMKSGLRKIVFAGVVANITGKEGLTEEQIRTRDHQRHIAGQITLAMQVAPKALE
jgi:hypothetical protein